MKNDNFDKNTDKSHKIISSEAKEYLEKYKSRISNKIFEIKENEIETSKREIYEFVTKNLRYPSMASSDVKELLLAYKYAALDAMKIEIEESTNPEKKADMFNLLSFFADLDYVLSGKLNKRDSNKDSATLSNNKAKSATDILSENKEIVLKILSLQDEIEKLNQAIADKLAEISNLHDKYKSNTFQIENLMDEHLEYKNKKAL